jgi:hypothetical protein
MSRNRLFLGALVGATLVLAACGSSPAAPVAEEESPPAVVTPVEGSEDLHTVALTPRAAERIGIQTAAVARAAKAGFTVIPYSSVHFGSDGEAWAYVEGEPLVYERKPITVDTVVGEDAFLTAGPAEGTMVVSVGVAELFGAESGLGGGH